MMEMPSHLHPMVVHFPIALFITALLFDVLSFILKQETFHKCAVYMYVSAALIMPLILRTGMMEAEKLKLSHPLLDDHSKFAAWTMWLSVMSLPVLWFINKEFPKIFRLLFFVLLLLTVILVSLTGDKGGQMVFEYAVGVNL